jgi:hypothetical protein
MSELGKELLGGGEEIPREKIKYISDEIQKLDPAKMNEVVKKIYDKFKVEIFRRSATPLMFGDKALDYFMKGKKINVALEIGTYNGISTSLMSEYADHVITIDILDNKIKYKVWDYLGIRHKIFFYHIKNEDEKEKLIKGLNFDFCFIDGDHCHYTYSDWMMARKCGKVLFHEYWEKQYPVWDLVRSLPKEEIEVFKMPHHILNKKGKTILSKKVIPYAYWEKKS